MSQVVTTAFHAFRASLKLSSVCAVDEIIITHSSSAQAANIIASSTRPFRANGNTIKSDLYSLAYKPVRANTPLLKCFSPVNLGTVRKYSSISSIILDTSDSEYLLRSHATINFRR
eukprot:Pompholyxophrys_punicea_v1_NODE_50_length_4350_cov_57.873807.p3 type:complete len:116 gc:universal NODE_50_length_4350_cov_57.873807:1599-1252(-)